MKTPEKEPCHPTDKQIDDVMFKFKASIVLIVVSAVVIVCCWTADCRRYDRNRHKYEETREQRMKREQKYRHKEAVHGDNYVPHRDSPGDH